jgi:hypothetical protein
VIFFFLSVGKAHIFLSQQSDTSNLFQFIIKFANALLIYTEPEKSKNHESVVGKNDIT